MFQLVTIEITVLAGAEEIIQNIIKLVKFAKILALPIVITEQQNLGRKTLILAGIEAHICVAHTALDAPHTYTPQVVSDAVASRDPRNRQIALDRMTAAGITIASTEMVMYELLKKAGTDEFRATLPLVK